MQNQRQSPSRCGWRSGLGSATIVGDRAHSLGVWCRPVNVFSEQELAELRGFPGISQLAQLDPTGYRPLRRPPATTGAT